jgi:hypothetical protein
MAAELFLIPAVAKLFCDTVDDGLPGAAKGIASMVAGPAGTLYDVYDMTRSRRRGRRSFGRQMAGLLVDPKTGKP